ncbi:unnamed protein product [Didymodactylos carnosus]|uniref:Tetraspanin n=1 Tax=Didymodactylos carnosus TaxID=1234261 RepID=A0A813ZK14_9BILA|nr:unnamed protein product [Didymodactylos carnosus]CAF3682318.1 unnamed protein product [Didymodactylos carnosus]
MRINHIYLTGIGLTSLGCYLITRSDIQQIVRLLNITTIPISPIEVAALLIILVGIIIFLIGLFGCCGAFRESRVCLAFYIISVILVFIVQITVFIIMAMFYNELEYGIRSRLKSNMKNYNYVTSSPYEYAIDSIQKQHKCCGIDSAYDYGELRLPSSCCSVSASSSQCTINDINTYGISGCYKAIVNSVTLWTKIIIGITFGLCILALFGILFAVCLFRNVYDGYIKAPYPV